MKYWWYTIAVYSNKEFDAKLSRTRFITTEQLETLHAYLLKQRKKGNPCCLVRGMASSCKLIQPQEAN